MRTNYRVALLFIALLIAAPAFAQVPNEVGVAQAVAADGYFAKCEAGDIRACSYYARLVAFRLNPTGNPASWGWLSKNPGESQVDGFADDAIVYGPGQNNVIDLVGGSGAPGARVQWGGPNPRRPSNLWVRPRALTSEELAYLKPGSTGGGGPPVVPPVVLNLQPVLDAIEALAMRVEALSRELDTFRITEAGRAASSEHTARDTIERIDRAHQDVLIAIDLAKQQMTTTYSGRVPAFGGSVTLKPNRP